MPKNLSEIGRLLHKFWSPVLIAYAISGGVAVASFLATMILARIAGAAVIGEYALAISTATLLIGFTFLGLDRILIREVAGDLRQGQEADARATFFRIFRITLGVTVTTSLLYAALVLWTPFASLIGGSRPVLILIALALPSLMLAKAGYSGLRAVGSPVLGQLAEAGKTYFFMAGILLFWLTGHAPDARTAVGLSIIANLLTAAGAWLFLAPCIHRWPGNGSAKAPGVLLAAGMPLMGSLFLQLFSDWFILARISAYAGAADTGAFRVAVQIITIVSIVAATTESYMAAFFAGDFRINRPDLAWKRHFRSTLLMLALTTPAFLILFGMPGFLLGTAFGPEFTVAATALVIMTVGQLFNVLRGPLGSLLVMAGHQNAQFALTVGGLLIAVVCAWLLIPPYGLPGAAMAQASAIIFRSVAGYAYARFRIPSRAPGCQTAS